MLEILFFKAIRMSNREINKTNQDKASKDRANQDREYSFRVLKSVNIKT